MKKVNKITIKPIPLLIIKIVGVILCILLGFYLKVKKIIYYQ